MAEGLRPFFASGYCACRCLRWCRHDAARKRHQNDRAEDQDHPKISCSSSVAIASPAGGISGRRRTLNAGTRERPINATGQRRITRGCWWELRPVLSQSARSNPARACILEDEFHTASKSATSDEFVKNSAIQIVRKLQERSAIARAPSQDSAEQITCSSQTDSGGKEVRIAMHHC
jgi:hypothetical protein